MRLRSIRMSHPAYQDTSEEFSGNQFPWPESMRENIPYLGATPACADVSHVQPPKDRGVHCSMFCRSKETMRYSDWAQHRTTSSSRKTMSEHYPCSSSTLFPYQSIPYRQQHIYRTSSGPLWTSLASDCQMVFEAVRCTTDARSMTLWLEGACEGPSVLRHACSAAEDTPLIDAEHWAVLRGLWLVYNRVSFRVHFGRATYCNTAAVISFPYHHMEFSVLNILIRHHAGSGFVKSTATWREKLRLFVCQTPP